LHTFKHALRTQDFSLTAELALNAFTGRAELIAQAKALAPDVDAIQLPESIEKEVHLAQRRPYCSPKVSIRSCT
jgi:hypothetical protein